MTYPEYETFLRESSDYLKARIENADVAFGIKHHARYEYDLYRGEIWWGEVGAPKVRGRVTIVGSISTNSNTWLWAWANPHFSDVKMGDIGKVRDFGTAEAIAKLTEPKWDAEEVDGWEMTALAARLLEASGAYRSPSETGFLFLLYDNLEWIPSKEMGNYMPLKREEGNEQKLLQNQQPGTKLRVLNWFRRCFGRSRRILTDVNWPFDQPKNCAAITMRQVLEKKEPILLVSHDADDHGWQFIGSSDASVQDGRLVCLEHIVELDPSVREVADLPPGWQAIRASKNAPWQRRMRPTGADD